MSEKGGFRPPPPKKRVVVKRHTRSAPSPAAQRQGNTPASRRARPKILAQQRPKPNVFNRPAHGVANVGTRPQGRKPQPKPRPVKQRLTPKQRASAERTAGVLGLPPLLKGPKPVKAAPYKLLSGPGSPKLTRPQLKQANRQTRQFRSAYGPIGGTVNVGTKRHLDLGEIAGHALGQAVRNQVPGIETPSLAADVVGQRRVKGALGAVSRTSAKLSKKLAGSSSKYQTSGFPGGKLVQEALDIPAQTVTSTALGALAVSNAVRGRPGDLKQLVKQTKEHDPIALTLQGKPGKAFKEAKAHPIATALELSGVKAGLGRGLGAAGRHAGIEAASTERAPLRHYPKELGGGPTYHRAYSKDVLNKAAQVGVEKAKRKAGIDPNVERPSQLRANLGLRPRPKLAKRVNADVYGAEGVRRGRRQQVATKTAEQAPPTELPAAAKRRVLRKRQLPRKEAHATYLIAEGTIRSPKTVRADLSAHLTRLDNALANEGKTFTHAERRSNREEAKAVQKLLNDPKFIANPHEAFKGARAFARDQNARSRREVELGIRPEGDLNARLTPYAVNHMGARWNPKTKRLEGPPMTKTARVKAQAQVPLARRLDIPTSAKAMLRAERANKIKPGAKLRQDVLQTGQPERMAIGGRAEVTPEQIKAHMKANGVNPEDIAHISQRPIGSEGSAFYVPTRRGLDAPYPHSKRRTGEATARGTREATPRAMMRQGVESEGVISAIESFHRDANVYSIKPGGKPQRSWGKAQQIGHELTHHADTGELKKGHVALVPMNLAPFRAVKDQLQAIREHASGAEPTEEIAKTLSEATRRAFEKPPGGNGEFVLVPKDVADLWKDHQFRSLPGEQQLRKITSAWKHSILTTAAPVSWLTGNVIDLGIRSTMAGLNPLGKLSPQIVRMRKVAQFMKDLEDKGHVPKGEAMRFQETHLGGGFYHGSQMDEVHSQAAVDAIPVLKQLHKAYKGYYSNVFRGEGWLERQPMYAAAGKAAKADIKRGYGSAKEFFKLGDAQLRDYARGLGNDPDKAAALGRQVEDVVGNWGKRSPEFRRFTMATGPFAQWLAVALRYVYITLPTKHPIKTGILAGLYQMTDEERRKLGLTLFPKKGQDSLVSYQQGGIPQGKGNIIRFQKFTSTGLIPGFLDNPASFFYPQFKGAADALNGVAWTGEQITYPPGSPKSGQPLSIGDKWKLSAYLLAEGFSPFLSTGRRLREKGGSSHPTSTIFDPQVWDKKKQTGYGEAANRIFNPFRPSKALPQHQFKKGAPRKKKGGGWGGLGGGSGGGDWGKL